MKLIFALIVTLNFAVAVQAEWVTTPSVEINADTFGGQLILIQMKEYLVISGQESLALEKELGLEGQAAFTQDLVMTKTVSEIRATYNSNFKRPTTDQIIRRYEAIRARLGAKDSLK